MVIVKVSGDCIQSSEFRAWVKKAPRETVYVVGGGSAISEALKDKGIPVEFVGERPKTSNEAVHMVSHVLGEKMRQLSDVVYEVNGTVPYRKHGYDLVRGKNVKPLGRMAIPERLLSEPFLPIAVTPVCLDERYELCVCDPDDFAVFLRKELGGKLVVFTQKGRVKTMGQEQLIECETGAIV